MRLNVLVIITLLQALIESNKKSIIQVTNINYNALLIMYSQRIRSLIAPMNIS
jgi:hypothetical protein